MATKKKAKAKAKKKETRSRQGDGPQKSRAQKEPRPKKRNPRQIQGRAQGKDERKPAVTPPPAAPVAPPGMERIGVVTHYYNHLSVAILKLEKGILRVGDQYHMKGHTSDFAQPVDSMEIDHAHVNEARPGQSFGLRVREHAREHDVVYKAKP